MAGARKIRAGRAVVELGVDQSPLQLGLKAASVRLRAFGASVGAVGRSMAMLGGAGLAPIVAASKLFVSVGSDLSDMAARTGLGVSALSELGFAAEQTGANMGDVENGVRRMQRTINDAERGMASAEDALAGLGLTAAALQGLKPEDQFTLIGERLAAIEDPTKRAALAMEILGRSGTSLLPMLGSLRELRAEAQDLGLTIDPADAAAADKLGDAFDKLWAVLKVGVFEVGAAVAGPLTALTEWMTGIAMKTVAWVKENRGLVQSIAGIIAGVTVAGVALVGIGAAVSGVGAVFGVLAGGVGLAISALGVMGTIIGAILSPIGLAVAAVAGLGAGILYWTGAGSAALGWLKDRFGELSAFVGGVVGGIRDSLAKGDIDAAAKILWAALKVTWYTGKEALISVWEEAKTKFFKVFSDLWYGALAAGEVVMHAIENAWINTTSFLSKTWSKFTGFFKKAWATASAAVQKGWNDLKGLFDEEFDAKAANEKVVVDLVGRWEEIDDETNKDIAERETQRKRQSKSAEELHQMTMAKIGEDSMNAIDAINALGGVESEGMRAAKAALEAAKADLATLIGQAKAPEVAGGGEERKEAENKIANAIAGLEDSRPLARASIISNSGEFASRFGIGGGSPIDRVAAAAEETAKNTKRLIRVTEENVLRFA